MTDYTKTGNPPQDGRGISKQIRDEFSLIETAVNSKANIDSPAFTGTPRVPTAALGSSGTQAASLDFVNGTAFSSALPAQTGNSGKFITTNGTTASWGFGNLIRKERTSNSILTTDEQSHFIDIVSGTFTQTFSACATLGSGWYCIIRNSGTGDITLEPNGTETIDGLTNFKMYPNEVRLIQCDGIALRSVVLSAFLRSFISSGTFTTPPGYKAFSGLIWGGGGGGTKSGGAGEAPGGAGGGCTPFTIPSSYFGVTETVTIGAGGAGGTATEGGNSTFGSFVTGYGAGTLGGGGVLSKGTSSTGGQPDNESSTGNNYLGGGDGAAGADGGSSYWGGGAGGGANAVSAGTGGSSVYGGAGGGGVTNAGVNKSGGTSIFGGNGGTSGDAGSGVHGSPPGGGGGATRTGAAAGNGARGELRVWGII